MADTYDSHAAMHHDEENPPTFSSSVDANGKKLVPSVSSMPGSAGTDNRTIILEEPPSDSDVGQLSDDDIKKKASKSSSTRARRAWDRRVCVRGFRCIPFWIFMLCMLTLCSFAIIIPTLYLGMGPTLAQKSVDHTYMSLHNIRVSDWAFTQTNSSDQCEVFAPSTMLITQDILFENMPWYGRLGPTWVIPSVLDLAYNGTVFAQLHLPKINLCDTEDGKKWANDTQGTMVVTNVPGFILANKELIPLGTVTKGWTIWHQSSHIILQQKLGVVTSYYSAFMSQDVNVSNPVFEDGPLQNTTLRKNLLQTLKCVAALASGAE